MLFNRNNELNQKLKVHIQPNIGMDSDVRLSVVKILNLEALAEVAVLM